MHFSMLLNTTLRQTTQKGDIHREFTAENIHALSDFEAAEGEYTE